MGSNGECIVVRVSGSTDSCDFPHPHFSRIARRPQFAVEILVRAVLQMLFAGYLEADRYGMVRQHLAD